MITQLISQFAAGCQGGGSFLGFPTWYHYLNGTVDPTTHLCTPQLSHLSDVWLIVAAVIEILLRVAALVAVFFVMYGGFTYLTSQGEPDKTVNARLTIINALVGLIIAIMAGLIVGYVAGRIQ